MVVKAVELDFCGKFLHEDKHQSFLQTVSIILYFGTFPKKESDEVNFLLTDKY